MSIFCGQVEIESNSSILVGGWLCPISTGSYYMYSKTASQSLVDVVASCFSTSLSFAVTASVSSAGILTLSAGSAFTVNWGTSTDIRDMLGYTGNLSSATSHTATNQLENTWIPKFTNGLVASPTELSSSYTTQGVPLSFTSQAFSVSGDVYTNYLGGATEQSFVFEYLSKANTWTNTGERSFEEFYNGIMKLGTPFIWLPEFTATTFEWSYVCKLENENKPDISRISSNDLFWKVAFTARGI